MTVEPFAVYGEQKSSEQVKAHNISCPAHFFHFLFIFA